jgi:hypothetical protein
VGFKHFLFISTVHHKALISIYGRISNFLNIAATTRGITMTKYELEELIGTAPKDEKGRPVIADSIFMAHLKDLPNGVVSDAGKISNSKGYLVFGQKNDARTLENCKKGGQATAEKWERRRTFAECYQALLDTEIAEGVTMREAICKAICEKAMEGNVRAFESIRDTCGEKPTENVSVDVMTDEDRILIQNVIARLDMDISM